ncbi:MAG: antirestriction protein [Bacteroidetes bacterium]|nr:antirestriction protein [Bacteroidota bacterium]
MDSITKRQVAEEQRLNFLPNFIGRHFLQYETAIYNQMSQSNVKYNGGYWDYYTLSNGGFYMALSQTEPLKMECVGNYFEGEMSADAGSIGVNLFVLNAFAWQMDENRFSTAYHQLRDYALDHPEARKILAFID